LTDISAIIVAGGLGVRAGSRADDPPKQYRRIGSDTVLARAVAPFLSNPRIATVQVVIRAGHGEVYAASVAPHERLLPPVIGGHRRQDSVRAGLEAIAGLNPDAVLIHDAARPFVGPDLIDRVIDALVDHDGVIPVVAVTDTIKRVSADGLVAATVARAELRAAQTPQGFRYGAIRAAHSRAAASGLDFTDDAAIAEWAGIAVACVAGDPSNRKLTTAEDFDLAEALMARQAHVGAFEHGTCEYRTGSGFDVHRFGPGDHVMLCGVRIAHDHALIGHSDADVGLHALTDALLGAVADGDIGSHFPPSDPRWRGAESALFLRHAAGLVAARGGEIIHADITVICETPKIGPHRDAMRARIADILGIAANRVAVKATTSEGLGFAGRREGIAAQATATVRLPEQRP